MAVTGGGEAVTLEEGLQAAGVGRFQARLLVVFGLVWAADAMQVLSIGFTAPSIARTFGVTVPQALGTGTAFFVGMLIGAFVFGRLADRVGRRPVLMVSILVDAAFGVASAFAPDLGWLVVLRLLTGIGVGGTLPVDYAMMAEFLPTARRGRWLVALESFWAVGTIVVAVLAWLAASQGDLAWRVIFFVTGIPAVIGLVLRLHIPESPRYLATTGRAEEARAVLRRVAEANGRAAAAIPPLRAETAARRSIAALLAPAYRRRTASLLLAWFLISVTYYGVFVYLPIRLSAQGFGFMRGELFLVLLALVQLPGYALAAYGVERWGRRPTLIGFLLLSAAGCLLFGLGTAPALVVGSTLLMSFAMLGTWAGVYAFTPEAYPTDLRASGMGTAGAVARLGGLLAPSVVAPVMVANFGLALAMMSGLLVVAAIGIAAIGVETRGRALG